MSQKKGQAVSFDSSCATTGYPFWGVVPANENVGHISISARHGIIWIKKMEIQIIKFLNECD
jgi:hypothetical protein